MIWLATFAAVSETTRPDVSFAASVVLTAVACAAVAVPVTAIVQVALETRNSAVASLISLVAVTDSGAALFMVIEVSSAAAARVGVQIFRHIGRTVREQD